MQETKYAKHLRESISRLEMRQAKCKKPSKCRQIQIEKMKQWLHDRETNVVPVIKHSRREAGKTEGPICVKAEAQFAELAKAAGWTVSKRGWPDFIMWKEGKLACVEVKLDLQPLRENQSNVLRALAGYGVPCFTWRPKEGFTKVINW